MSAKEPTPIEIDAARAILKRAEVRTLELADGTTIGIWSDLDGPEVRAALRAVGWDKLPLQYLDGGGIPAGFKLRHVKGEPVPMSVLAEMARRPEEPWKIRDELLAAMGWRAKPVTWAEWKASAINRVFLEQGVTGMPGRITAETVRHGERKKSSPIELQ